MSFEVFLQRFEPGEPAGVPRAEIRQLFPVIDAESEPDYWSVRYDDLNSCHLSITPLPSDPARTDCLCVYRPCGDIRLWNALFTVMRLGSMVLYFPGNGPPLVANTTAGEFLPPAMVEGLGQPYLVHSGREIVEIIERG